MLETEGSGFLDRVEKLSQASGMPSVYEWFNVDRDAVFCAPFVPAVDVGRSCANEEQAAQERSSASNPVKRKRIHMDFWCNVFGPNWSSTSTASNIDLIIGEITKELRDPVFGRPWIFSIYIVSQQKTFFAFHSDDGPINMEAVGSKRACSPSAFC